ncbi:hypothetical protein V2A60_006465 [Cordyceps javanica]
MLATTRPATTPGVWRDEGSGQVFNAPPNDFNSPDPSGLGPLRVLIPVTAAAWVLFGAGCILCINGKGRAGRWVPEWYLDSDGTRRDKASVAAWWLAVLLLWPVILPALLVGKVARAARGLAAKRAERREGRRTAVVVVAAAAEAQVTEEGYKAAGRRGIV